MAEINDLFNVLNSFETSGEIAAFLIEKGVKGDVQDGESCVLTNWFLTETDAIGCTTTEENIMVEDQNFITWKLMIAETPISEFITEFDDWQYPELIWSDEYDDESVW